MKTKFLLPLTALLSLLSTQALATAPAVNIEAHVGTYNLILQGDLTTNSDIEGRAFINGNVEMSGQVLEVGTHLPTSPTVDAVTIVGDINASIVRVFSNNNIVYGDESDIGSTSFEGGTSIEADTDTLENNFDAIWSQVKADSLAFKDLTSTGSLDSSDNNNMKFENDNSVDLNVFNITTTNLITNGGLSFENTLSAPVVINVSGSGTIDLTSKPIGNFSSGSSVLWNFYEATTINFNAGAWFGSILAPKAIVNLAGGNINGGVAAQSLNAQSELHNQLFTYNPPTTTPPTDEVPAPATILILALGLLLIAGRQLKK